MRTDPILEELYAVRAELMRRAGNNITALLAQINARAEARKLAEPERQWVDFTKEAPAHKA